MALNIMIFKCSQGQCAGRLFFSMEEVQDHCEAFGASHANVEQVDPESKVWVDPKTARYTTKEQQKQRWEAADPQAKFEEQTVTFVVELTRKRKEEQKRRDKFVDSVDQKQLETLATGKMYNRIRVAKALHFTRGQGIEAAEKWMADHEGEVDLDKLTDEFLNAVAAGAASGSGDVVMGDASADVEMLDPSVPDDRKVGDPNPPEVKEKINQELLKQVMEMGFDELRSEKALYKTDNAGLEYAVNWLAEHAEDADIDLPMLKPAAPKPKMSQEEAQAKAAELQRKLREKKAHDEKLLQKEQERMRVESTKMMVEASEKLKDEERKREIERMQREKDETERQRKELKEQLRLDYIERFGKEPPAEEEDAEKAVKEKSSKDQVAHYLSKLKKTYKDTDKEGLKTCLTTLRIYVKNLQDNPQDLKFKILKLDNKAFSTRIMPFEEGGALDFLQAIGFERKEGSFEQRKSVPDGWLCGNALKFIDLILSQL